MVGRTIDGDPLMPSDAAAIHGLEDNAGQPRNSFTYQLDPAGNLCPFGAHIRRANPRNADLYKRSESFVAKLSEQLGIPRAAYGEDLVASTRFHRILRRGREYGKPIRPGDALQAAPPGENPCGIHFACLNGNIARQFEFVQNA